MDRLVMVVPGTQDLRHPGGRGNRVHHPTWVEGSRLERVLLLPRQRRLWPQHRLATEVALRRLNTPPLQRRG